MARESRRAAVSNASTDNDAVLLVRAIRYHEQEAAFGRQYSFRAIRDGQSTATSAKEHEEPVAIRG
jgi:hypothetical protein